MSAEMIMDQYTEYHGLSCEDALALALEYIDNQGAPDAFRDFLEMAVARDELDREWLEGLRK